MYLLSRQDGSGGAGGAPGGAPMLPPPVNLPADPTAAVIAITVIMFIIVILKVGYRAFVVKHPQWDDLAAGLGALLTVAMTAVIVSVFNEAGLKHRALVSPVVVGAPQFTNRLFVYTLLSAVPNGFAKLAILSLLATVFPRIARPITAYFVYFGMAVVVLFYSILVIYTGVKCGPKNGVSCSVPTQVDLAKASTTVNLILDVYIMIISVWNIMSLQLTRRRKFGIVAVFLTGILALICSIIALYYRFTTSTEPNTAWTFILTPLVLAIYEPAIALIAACLPTYPALWKSTYNSPAFESVRNLLTSLTGSRGSFGSVELRDQPSHEHLHRPGTGASKPASKRSHETTTVDVATKSYSDERIRR